MCCIVIICSLIFWIIIVFSCIGRVGMVIECCCFCMLCSFLFLLSYDW